MPDETESPRRRDLLKASAAAGLLGVAGFTTNGASAQETTTAQADGDGALFSYSIQADDQFRVRFRPQTPSGEPATETVSESCLGGDQPEERQLLIVRAFRGELDLGFRGLLAPQTALAEDLPETTTEAEGGETAETTTESDAMTATTEDEQETATTTEGNETTEAAMQDETTTANETTTEVETTTEAGETTTEAETTTEVGETTTATDGEVPEIQLGNWYRATSAEACNGLNRLTVEAIQPPETTPVAGGEEVTTEPGDAETTPESDGAETTTTSDETGTTTPGETEATTE